MRLTPDNILAEPNGWLVADVGKLSAARQVFPIPPDIHQDQTVDACTNLARTKERNIISFPQGQTEILLVSSQTN